MTKHKITLEIDTDNLDLALSEIECWLDDMKFNQIDELTQKNLLNEYNMENEPLE